MNLTLGGYTVDLKALNKTVNKYFTREYYYLGLVFTVAYLARIVYFVYRRMNDGTQVVKLKKKLEAEKVRL